jgi:hypothetical protein
MLSRTTVLLSDILDEELSQIAGNLNPKSNQTCSCVLPRLIPWLRSYLLYPQSVLLYSRTNCLNKGFPMDVVVSMDE